jgi:hypothetical protein
MIVRRKTQSLILVLVSRITLTLLSVMAFVPVVAAVRNSVVPSTTISTGFIGVDPPLWLPSRRRRTMAPATRFRLANDVSDGNGDSNQNNDDAAQLRKRAAELREQARIMDEQLSNSSKNNRRLQNVSNLPTQPDASTMMTLKGKRILVAGANGRLGSMVCRYLLRQNPLTQVVAAVHYVSEDGSPTSRGYGRLSYEVGAEDGIGRLGPAWSSADDRTATFEWDASTMRDYNLQNLRLVECELLDPVQCQSVAEGCDALIWW